ncbi:MAG: hypothetical protein COA71_12890 [SAR86 cluster bacterium]|uniref:DUF3500 domain-containing protein n=1 Tax=SAR86 cluster bacterium TaxID=2030880 RepID=A0A2A5C7J0_9GAMM|nr:MAG: hypothetical protein COA71_12890 [SAR86 cluster bacterium]
MPISLNIISSSFFSVTKYLRFVLIFSSLIYPSLSMAQSEYNPGLLAVKKMFADIEINALAEAYTGVGASSGLESGLFPIASTGVSTQPLVDAAEVFLSSLSPSLRIKAQYAVGTPEWRRWSNIDNGIYVRQGASFEEMNNEQKGAAWNLLSSSLSSEGVELSRSIMKTDQTLREINNDTLRYGEEKYFIKIMGVPSESEPWGWQLNGHHLAINYFILGDQVVVAPMFLGGEPVITETGRHAGNTIFQQEQAAGLQFVQSLDAGQRNVAIIEENKTSNTIQAEAWQDNLVLDYEGLLGQDLTEVQQDNLIDLISLFVNNIRDEHALVKMEEVIAHINDTYFSWVGGTEDDAVFYFRIHSPVILIEFDHQGPVGNPALARGVPTRQHIHVVVRTPNGNDYGKDLLRQHLALHPH